MRYKMNWCCPDLGVRVEDDKLPLIGSNKMESFKGQVHISLNYILQKQTESFNTVSASPQERK